LILNKDSWTLGVILGIVLPVIVYAILITLLSQYGYVENLIYTPRPKVPFLAAVAGNLLPFRYYMVNKKYDRTGRGLLLVTFLIVVLVFSILR
jgi:hypothetical protein